MRFKLKNIAFILLPIVLSFSVSAKTEFDVYKCVDNDDKKIALTFDDGPHGILTPEILDILDEYGVKATFFVVGKNIDQNPDVLRRIADGGHEIGNHTESHINCCKSSRRRIKQELMMVHEKVLEICDYDMKLFRPPGGSMNKNVKNVTDEMKYSVVLWSIDTKDWAHSKVSSISDNISEKIKGGSIILFHDYITKNSPTPMTLKKVIPELMEKGYSFVTVGELISEYGRV